MAIVALVLGVMVVGSHSSRGGLSQASQTSGKVLGQASVNGTRLNVMGMDLRDKTIGALLSLLLAWGIGRRGFMEVTRDMGDLA